jgi:hypothetical protein
LINTKLNTKLNLYTKIREKTLTKTIELEKFDNARRNRKYRQTNEGRQIGHHKSENFLAAFTIFGSEGAAPIGPSQQKNEKNCGKQFKANFEKVL